jgi:capsid portal protein
MGHIAYTHTNHRGLPHLLRGQIKRAFAYREDSEMVSTEWNNRINGVMQMIAKKAKIRKSYGRIVSYNKDTGTLVVNWEVEPKKKKGKYRWLNTQ